MTPRRPRTGGPSRPRAGGGSDDSALVVRRRVALGVALVLVVVIVVFVSSCVKNQKLESLKSYNREATAIASESDSQVSAPLFIALTNSSTKSALDVEGQVDQLLLKAQELASRTSHLSVPGSMESAQRAMVMAMNLREEGMTKLASHVRLALGGSAKPASTLIAGDMEIFLASDVLFSQRVTPLIQEALASESVQASSTPTSRFVPNVGWLSPETVFSRVTGQPASSSSTGVAPGNHGSALIGVTVGATELQAEPALNHISGGGNPTFTVVVENSGSFNETDVKVDVTVTSGGKQYKTSKIINETTPGNKSNVEIPVAGVPTGAASKVEVYVEPVPGENDLENNKATYLAIFE